MNVALTGLAVPHRPDHAQITALHGVVQSHPEKWGFKMI
jgi:hypothetical protein